MCEDDLPGQLGELIRYGTVETVDLAGARVTVRLGDIETGPLRWMTHAAGDTRVWSPPSKGEQVLLLAPDGDIEGAIAVRGVVSTDRPPAGNTLRELIEFADGAVLAYDPEAHALEAILPAGGTAKIEARGGITLIGDVTVEGNVAVQGKIDATGNIASEADVKAGSISLTNHRHPGVQAGSGMTQKPV